jgi:hypothetical protein
LERKIHVVFYHDPWLGKSLLIEIYVQINEKYASNQIIQNNENKSKKINKIL